MTSGINQVFEKTFLPLTPTDISEQCISIHFNVLPAMERYFKCKAYLTIGSVRDHKNNYFDMTDEYISQTLSFGIMSKYKLHCWITLDSLEIIDATLATTIGVHDGPKDLIGQMLAIHPDNLPDIGSKLVYTPKILGSSYLESIGINPRSGVAFVGASSYRKPSIYTKLKSNMYSVLDKT
ncbi:hypothetical protein [Thiomicrospira microaerophila]|uniref:hypothetical protein n=1 Tax=Thiomicrospira microaerophila TaxID=406020 RepID=UPI0012FE5524|nr:hypothetical protein [Thiomicrospira microaerophila]